MSGFDPMNVITQIAILFFVLLCGFFAAKRGFFSSSTPRSLSMLLINVTQPFLILASFDMEYSETKINTGLLILGVSVGVHLSLSLLARLLFAREKEPDQNRVFRYAFLFSNCAFLGYPVLDAIFGAGVGVFYGTFYCIMFNVYNFTYGIALLRRGRGETPKWYRAILNPGVLSTLLGLLLFCLRVRLPAVLSDSFRMVGNMTFPLSMIIIGALLASIPLRELFCDKRLYLFCAAKLLALPLLAIGICKLFGFSGPVALVSIVMCAVPSAASSAIFAESYDSDSRLAARLVGLSTLFSLVSLPAIVLLAGLLL